jgi:hypothetical protein
MQQLKGIQFIKPRNTFRMSAISVEYNYHATNEQNQISNKESLV